MKFRGCGRLSTGAPSGTVAVDGYFVLIANHDCSVSRLLKDFDVSVLGHFCDFLFVDLKYGGSGNIASGSSEYEADHKLLIAFHFHDMLSWVHLNLFKCGIIRTSVWHSLCHPTVQGLVVERAFVDSGTSAMGLFVSCFKKQERAVRCRGKDSATTTFVDNIFVVFRWFES